MWQDIKIMIALKLKSVQKLNTASDLDDNICSFLSSFRVKITFILKQEAAKFLWNINTFLSFKWCCTHKTAVDKRHSENLMSHITLSPSRGQYIIFCLIVIFYIRANEMLCGYCIRHCPLPGLALSDEPNGPWSWKQIQFPKCCACHVYPRWWTVSSIIFSQTFRHTLNKKLLGESDRYCFTGLSTTPPMRFGPSLIGSTIIWQFYNLLQHSK
jgi:hypothetical protein